MIESVHCPQCQLHYGLRPQRVRYGLRRAKCFKCGGVFDIEDQVTRLLAAALPQESSAGVFLEPFAQASPAASAPLVAEALPSEWEDLSALEELPAPEPLPPTLPPVPAPDEMPNSLTLQDLEGTEDEMMDKTLVDYQAPPLPAPAPISDTAEAAATTSPGGYSSAMEAINKILGSGPVSPAPVHHAKAGGAMDVDATLDALEQTLGGATHLPPPPSPPPAELLEEDVPDYAQTTLHTGIPAMPAAPPTTKLTREQMLAALSTPIEAPNAEVEPPHAMPLMPPPPSPQGLMPPLQPMAPIPPPPPPPVSVPSGGTTAFMAQAESQDQNLFKVQVGPDLYSNLSLEQMGDMVNQGRLSDFHMVARQFSENWIEAGKVPALRPLFDRFRRERLGEAPAPEPTQKRSLFGGLFGRKDH